MAKQRTESTNSSEDSLELEERVVGVKRVAKVVKGGRRFGFSVLVVVGDRKGRVGYGSGKAKEVGDAKVKAIQAAKRAMRRVPLREGRTLHHDVKGHYGSGKVIVRSSVPGTGIIAGGPLRAVFECLGVQDVVAKSTGSSNPHNMVKACFDALLNMHSPRAVADRRGMKVGEVVGRRESSGSAKDQEHNDGL
jgi:small subunit ribosomal protein S5